MVKGEELRLSTFTAQVLNTFGSLHLPGAGRWSCEMQYVWFHSVQYGKTYGLMQKKYDTGPGSWQFNLHR